MSQQSNQSQPTQAVYFFVCFYFAYYLFSITLKECQKHPGNILWMQRIFAFLMFPCNIMNEHFQSIIFIMYIAVRNALNF